MNILKLIRITIAEKLLNISVSIMPDCKEKEILASCLLQYFKKIKGNII